MYQLGSLLIFGQILISAYVGGCIKNVLLSICKNTNGCWMLLLPASKAFTATKSCWLWYKGFLNKSLGVAWKYCLRNFKNSEIDCTISQKKINSLLELQKLDEKDSRCCGYMIMSKNYCSEDLKHMQINVKNVSTS